MQRMAKAHNQEPLAPLLDPAFKWGPTTMLKQLICQPQLQPLRELSTATATMYSQ